MMKRIMPSLCPRGFKPRPYRKGERLRHRGLGACTFRRHIRNPADHRYEVTLDADGRVVELLAAFCVGRLRKLSGKRRT